MRATVIALLLLALPLLGYAQGVGDALEAPAAPAPEAQGEGLVVMLTVTWPGADLMNASFRVFADATMREPLDVFPAPGGSALAVLPPGEYYVMAIVDLNGNNVADAGDGFGFHGVSGLTDGSRPSPLTVAPEQFNSATIPILLVQGPDGRLMPIGDTTRRTTGTLEGSFEKGGPDPGGATTLLAILPVESGVAPVVRQVGYEFELQVPAGAHRLVVVADTDASGTISPGDLMVQRGFRDEPITIEPEGTTVIGPLVLAPCEQVPEGIPPLLAGYISGITLPENARATVTFCTDQTLREEAFSVVADASGRFATAVPPAFGPGGEVSEAAVTDECPAGGTHEVGERDSRGRLHCAKCGRFIKEPTPPAAPKLYLRLGLDMDADGHLGPGDMLGFFGVDDILSGETPAPIEISAATLRTDLEVQISARIDAEGQLTAVTSAAPDADTTAPVDAGE
jgi:hypothetical protein